MRITLLLAAFVLAACLPGRGQLIVTTNNDATALAQRLVGDGVLISNAQLKGSRFSSGFFTNLGGNRIGIDSGIVLTNGRAETSPPFLGLSGTHDRNADNRMNTAGDADLSAQIGGTTTFDADILEFDFIPLGDTIRFRYVFSSEEYPDYNCSDFNDVFAFFISGPGIPGIKNIALVPNTNIPVAINSVNDGTVVPANGNIATCISMGPGSPFTQLYVSNFGNTEFTHDGHTVVFEAIAIVQPCQTYHLKLAIADGFDPQFDSAVFLEAKSLSASSFKGDPTFPSDDGKLYLAEGCNNGSFKVLAPRKLPTQQLITLAFGGTAINGTDVATIPTQVIIPSNDSVAIVPVTPIVDNLPEGIEVLKVYISGGCSNAAVYSDSIVVEIRDYDKMTMLPADSAGACRNTGFPISASAGYTTYLWDNALTLSNPAIRNPVATPVDDRTVYICTADLGDCHARDSIVLVLKKLNLLSKTDVNCRNGNNGVIRTGGSWAWKYPLQFSLGNSGVWQTDSTFNNLTAGTYVVKVRDADNCIDSVTVTIAQAFPDLDLQETITSASCTGQNGQVVIAGQGGLGPYQYSINGTDFSATPTFTITGGNQTIYVSDQNNCRSQKNIVVPLDPPITLSETITPAGCSGTADGTITITANGGSGTYEYALGSGGFQPGNVLNSVSGAASYTVRDNKGCAATRNVQVPLTNTVTVDAGLDDAICEGTSKQLNATSNATVFSWTPTASLSNAAIQNPVARPVTSTKYYVTATSGICTRTDSVTINVNAAPIPNAGPDSIICFGRTIGLTGSGGATYLWEPATYLTATNIRDPQTRPQKTIVYRLMVTDAIGCESLRADSVRITVTPAVKLFAGNDTIAAIGQPLQLTAVELGGSGVTSYTWQPSTGLNNATIPNPIAILDRDVLYTVTGKTPQDCEGSDQVFVKVYKGPEIYVPDAFTPNGDGLNDRLFAIPVGMKELKSFSVYNRWGRLVFSTVRGSEGWDGTMKGLQQGANTYVWFAEAIDYNGKTVKRKGSVLLIR